MNSMIKNNFLLALILGLVTSCTGSMNSDFISGGLNSAEVLEADDLGLVSVEEESDGLNLIGSTGLPQDFPVTLAKGDGTTPPAEVCASDNDGAVMAYDTSAVAIYSLPFITKAWADEELLLSDLTTEQMLTLVNGVVWQCLDGEWQELEKEEVEALIGLQPQVKDLEVGEPLEIHSSETPSAPTLPNLTRRPLRDQVPQEMDSDESGIPSGMADELDAPEGGIRDMDGTGFGGGVRPEDLDEELLDEEIEGFEPDGLPARINP